MVDVPELVADHGLAGPPLAFVVWSKLRAGHPEIAHEDAVELLEEVAGVRDLAGGNPLVDPIKRVHIVHELTLGFCCRLEFAFDRAFCLDDRELVPFDQS